MYLIMEWMSGVNSEVSKLFDVKLNNSKSVNFQKTLKLNKVNNFFVLFYLKIFYF